MQKYELNSNVSPGHFKEISVCFMCVIVLPALMYMAQLYAWYPRNPVKVIASPGVGVKWL